MIMDTKKAVDSGASSKWIISSSERNSGTFTDRRNLGGIEYTSTDGRSSITSRSPYSAGQVMICDYGKKSI